MIGICRRINIIVVDRNRGATAKDRETKSQDGIVKATKVAKIVVGAELILFEAEGCGAGGRKDRNSVGKLPREARNILVFLNIDTSITIYKNAGEGLDII